MFRADQTSKNESASRLAVFEQIKCKNNVEKEDKRDSYYRQSTSKRDLSDDELVIDEDDDPSAYLPLKKRCLGVRLKVEPLNLICTWKECQGTFKVYDTFMKHLFSHLPRKKTGVTNFTCFWYNCNYSATEHCLLKQHISYHGYHTRLKNIGSNILERIKLPKCFQPEELEFPELLNGHECEWKECDRLFSTVYEFHQHMLLHINNNPKYCPKNEFITCDWKYCTYKFNSQYKLADHLRTHTKEKVVACPACGSMFSTKTKFSDHRRRQLPIELQTYQCSQCSKLFPSERLLRDHMRSHINHYKCSLCDMTCTKPSTLATHIRYRHLSVRPMKCNFCDHSCVSKQALETHLLTHITEKLIACQECDFRCRSLVGLDRHYHKVHNQGWTPTYECHCCKVTFPRGNMLTKHLIKKHDFHWPSGHSRFRYKEESDGIYRLQTVRYESIEVTEEMMREKDDEPFSTPQISSLKFNLTKQEQSSDKTPSYVLMVAENGEQNVACPTDNNIVITISDIDDHGNVVNSEVVRSNEIKIMDPKVENKKKDS